VPAPLIVDSWRRPVYVVTGVAAAVVAALAVIVFHGTSTSFDGWVFDRLYRHVGAGTANAMLGFSIPAVSISLLVAVLALALLLRRWELAALAVLGPSVTLLVTEAMLKPLIGRTLGSGSVLNGRYVAVPDVYPSGHEATVAATACVLLIAVCQLPMRRRIRAAVVVVLATWTLVAALGLVRSFWHFATDTIGAICLSVAIVLCVALVIDRYSDAVFRRWAAATERQLTWRS
jgi:hypothetical protein